MVLQAAWWQDSLSQGPAGSSPSSGEIQDLGGCRSCAVLNRGTCTMSSKHMMVVSLHLAAPALGLVGADVGCHCRCSRWAEGLLLPAVPPGRVSVSF